MKKIIFTLATTLAALRLFGQGTLLVDQQSFDLATSTTAINIDGIGQSFTPMFSSIDYIQLGVSDSKAGSLLFVNLRQNSMTGPITGTTDTQPITTIDAHLPTTFLFSSTVPLTPGVQYFLEPVIVVNALQISVVISPVGTDPYPGGTALHGTIPGSYDLWFAEGVVVPEPSTWALFGLGGVVLFAAKWRRWTFLANS
jgi:hypothetical protein